MILDVMERSVCFASIFINSKPGFCPNYFNFLILISLLILMSHLIITIYIVFTFFDVKKIFNTVAHGRFDVNY